MNISSFIPVFYLDYNRNIGKKKKRCQGIKVIGALLLHVLYELFDLKATVTLKHETLILQQGNRRNKLAPVVKFQSYTYFIPPYFILSHYFFHRQFNATKCFQKLYDLTVPYLLWKLVDVLMIHVVFFFKESCRSDRKSKWNKCL